jgi:hypothetical protein
MEMSHGLKENGKVVVGVIISSKRINMIGYELMHYHNNFVAIWFVTGLIIAYL